MTKKTDIVSGKLQYYEQLDSEVVVGDLYIDGNQIGLKDKYLVISQTFQTQQHKYDNVFEKIGLSNKETFAQKLRGVKNYIDFTKLVMYEFYEAVAKLSDEGKPAFQFEIVNKDDFEKISTYKEHKVVDSIVEAPVVIPQVVYPEGPTAIAKEKEKQLNKKPKNNIQGVFGLVQSLDKDSNRVMQQI